METITPYPSQVNTSLKAIKLLNKQGVAYIYGKPRSGKTLTALLVAKMYGNVLVLTKKKAIPGWEKYKGFAFFDVTNYEQAHKIDKQYDLVIVDEAHNLGVIGRPNKRFKTIKSIANNSHLLCLSGTPWVESPCSIYHQIAVSKYGRDFIGATSFFYFADKYCNKSTLYVYGRTITEYKTCKVELSMKLKELVVTLDPPKEMQGEDKLHYIVLSEKETDLYNRLLKDQVLLEYDYIADSDMKLRVGLHQIEGGTLRLNEVETIQLIDIPAKVKYIKENFDLSKNIGIMSHFTQEQRMLKELLPECEIYSSKAHQEGVDLSHLDTFIIYSQDYSGVGFIQRRDRIQNSEGSNTNTIHHLLVKNAISDQVYKVTSQKKDFNNAEFKKYSI